MAVSKKYFLIWADNGPEINQLINTLADRGHELVYWVGLKENTSKFKDIIFQDHYEAWEGNSAPGLEKMMIPPSANLITKMFETESMVLTMMDKRFDSVTTNARKHLYYRMLGYWDQVLNYYKPDLIIFPAVPHTVYNYIIYDLAHARGIKTIMFEDSWIVDRLLGYSDWRVGNVQFSAKLTKYRDHKFTLTDLPEDLQDYYRLQTTPTEDATPLYMQEQRKKFSTTPRLNLLIRKALTAIRDGSLFKRTAKYLRRRREPNLAKEHGRLAQTADLARPYVYVPLSFQPERTTCPQGDIFVDQILMVETVAAALPTGWEIYVKEHPSQWWLRGGVRYSAVRFSGYYERLAAIPNVRLVPLSTNTYDLISHARTVATSTGTAGWEALLRSIPTIIFGYPWYRDCPEVFRADGVVSCREAFGQILAGVRPRPAEMIKFLKVLDEVCIPGHLEGYFDKVWKFTKEASIANVTKEIIKVLES